MPPTEEWLLFFYRMFPSGFYYQDLTYDSALPENFWTDHWIIRMMPDRLSRVIAQLVDLGVSPALSCSLFYGNFQQIDGSIADIALRSHAVDGELYLILVEKE